MKESQVTRRQLLGSVAAIAGMHALPLSGMAANNRALVCIYLFGGSDSNNLLVPERSYDQYAVARGPLALSRDSLLMAASRPDQTVYGFHPSLGEVRSLFEAGALGVVSNVGDVSGALPPPMDAHLSYFTPGVAVPRWAVSLAGANADQERSGLFTDFPDLMGGARGTSMSLVAPGVNASPELRKWAFEVAQEADPGAGVAFPATGLGQQLRQVTALITRASALGMSSGQVFLVTLRAVSNGTNQMPAQAELFRELSSAMGAFHEATLRIGKAQDVTTYTDSEYARTLLPNASGGSDPAWGCHHLVMGGAVQGGRVHGAFPDLTPGGRNDAGKRGSWIPGIAKEQYAATLANWLGVPSHELHRHIPGVTRYRQRTLDFLVTG